MIDFEKTIGLNMFCPVCGKKIQNVNLSIEGEGPAYQEIAGTCNSCDIRVKVYEYRNDDDRSKNIGIRDRWNKIFRSEFKTITKEDIESTMATHRNGLGVTLDGYYINTNEILSADAQKYCEEHNIRVIKGE
jgi:hypothetical protein